MSETDAADLRAQALHGKAGGERQRGNRDADRSEGHRRGVGQQADGRRLKRGEAQPRQHGRGYRHRGAESGGAFDKRAEGERDQERLQTAVVRQVADGVLEHFEFAALHRDAVEQNGGENHPPDRKQAERRAIGRGRAEPGQRRQPGRLAEHAQQ
jgi:hypothetical protein